MWKSWPLQNQLKHLHKRQGVQNVLLPKKAPAESYIYPLLNIMEKRAFPKGNYFAPKGIIKNIAEFPQDLSPGSLIQSCFLGVVSPNCILCLEIKTFLRNKCYCCHMGDLALKMLCEGLFLALSWLWPLPPPS